MTEQDRRSDPEGSLELAGARFIEQLKARFENESPDRVRDPSRRTGGDE